MDHFIPRPILLFCDDEMPALENDNQLVIEIAVEMDVPTAVTDGLFKFGDDLQKSFFINTITVDIPDLDRFIRHIGVTRFDSVGFKFL